MPTPTTKDRDCLACPQVDAECFVCHHKLHDGRDLVPAKRRAGDRVVHKVHDACAKDDRAHPVT